jgi:hypothetical protein
MPTSTPFDAGWRRSSHIEMISDELRAIVERNWPHLIAKLPPVEG